MKASLVGNPTTSDDFLSQKPKHRPTFIALKSFGDLVIQQYSIGRIEHSESSGELPCTLYGSHLSPLYQTLETTSPGVELFHGESNVPSFYDAKKYGIRSAIASGLRLRRLLSKIAISTTPTFVFDRIALREKFLAGSHPCLSLPQDEPNIYLAYEKFIRNLGYRLLPANSRSSEGDGTIAIFAQSRVSRKSFPPSLLLRLFRDLKDIGVQPVGYAMPGDQVPVELTEQFKKIPAQFSSVRDVVKNCLAVISADSMPAHMANYFNVPVYVLTPTPNEYWLPPDAFAKHRWQTFEVFMKDQKSTLSMSKSLGLNL